MLNRLVGLETEYAIRFHPDDPHAIQPADYQLYHALVQTLAKRVLTVPASDLKEGVFFGTGGAVWFERVRFAGGFGLVEGSTPECRGPREALLFQRAQDLLLAEAARDADVPGSLALIKNDCDSQGHTYGAQENYELTLATGWRLKCWRAGLVALFPCLLLAWLGHALLLVALVVYLVLAGILCVAIFPFLAPAWRKPVQAALLGDEISGRVTYSSPVPEWVEASALGFIRVAAGPLALGLYLLVRLTAFHRVRRDLLPFLISRPILGGAGFVTEAGEFQLSDKAWALNCLLGYNGIVFDRPIFSIGHFFKALMFRAWASPREFVRLTSPRQRLQICLGDSNVAEEAEYLRVGATMLVLDVIEAGLLPEVPVPRRPIAALKAICADPALAAKIPCRDGVPRTALEIQRIYYEACARFVGESSEATEEARDLIRRWGEVLTLLESNPPGLVGRLDWVTKRFLLEQTAAEEDDLAVQKKIDLRYHELSPDGYYRRLESTGITRAILTPDEIEQATRTAPRDTPATLRSRYLREFSAGELPLKVNWNTITLGKGWNAKTIELAQPPASDPLTQSPAPGPDSKEAR